MEGIASGFYPFSIVQSVLLPFSAAAKYSNQYSMATLYRRHLAASSSPPARSMPTDYYPVASFLPLQPGNQITRR